MAVETAGRVSERRYILEAEGLETVGMRLLPPVKHSSFVENLKLVWLGSQA